MCYQNKTTKIDQGTRKVRKSQEFNNNSNSIPNHCVKRSVEKADETMWEGEKLDIYLRIF